jgi:hypothetical protein
LQQREIGIVDWAARTRAGRAIAEWTQSAPFFERLGVIAMVTVVFMLATVTWLRPGYNWDMVAYIAAALEDEIDDPVELHAKTWKEIEKGATENDLKLLRYDQGYQQHQWENPGDFASMLSMYRVKAGYIATLRALAPVTGLYEAAILLSIVPSVAFGALCLYWLKRENALQGALVLVPALALADYIHMTTIASPDMMATLLSVTAIYFLTRNRDVIACLLLYASVLFRPDSLILLFALLITAVVFGWRKWPFAVTFIAAFATSEIISRSSGYPGWWAHFYFSCVELQYTMVGFRPPFSLTAFLKGYLQGAVTSLTDYNWPQLLVSGILAWRLLALSGKTAAPRFNALMFALVIAVAGKFASFPLPEDRYYFKLIASMAILLVANWKPQFSSAPVRSA